MNFEETIRKHFPKDADRILKDFPAEDPDMSKMSSEELERYVNG